MEKIPCTIGVLAYNNAGNLPRALESIKDFAEVIVGDGGSSDGTQDIARRFGARVIEQSQQGKPIADFSLERNRLLEATTQPWFFYLDADEVMSVELRDDIRCATEQSEFGAYRVRYLKTNADVSKKYRTYREYYQIRLTRTDIGAKFERPVHERIVPPAGTKIGQIEGPWYVPLDRDDLSYRVFFPKAWKRTGGELAKWQPRGLVDICHKTFVHPGKLIAKSLFKMLATPLKWGSEAIPLKYEFLRVLYALMLSVRAFQRLVGGL